MNITLLSPQLLIYLTVAVVYAIRLALSEVGLQKYGGATIPVTEFETTSAVLNRHDSRPITLLDYPLHLLLIHFTEILFDRNKKTFPKC